MREARPTCPTIGGEEQGASAGAQEDAIRVMGIITEAADIAAIRPNR